MLCIYTKEEWQLNLHVQNIHQMSIKIIIVMSIKEYILHFLSLIIMTSVFLMFSVQYKIISM